MNIFPYLETERLFLDETTLNDSEALFKMFTDPSVTEFYDLDVFKSESEALDLIQKDAQAFLDGKNVRWAVRRKDTSEFIGGCGVNHFEPEKHVAVIGYEFTRTSWGQGFATEALIKSIQFIFSRACPQHINRIEAYTMIGNDASEAILTKLGFKCEGTLRDYGFWKNKYHDLKIFSLLRSDTATDQML